MDTTDEQPEPPANRRTRLIAAASNRRNQWVAVGAIAAILALVAAAVLSTDESEVEDEDAGVMPSSGGWTWSLDHEVSVEGHSRQQAHGPGHSLRKDIWIDPYTKGSSEAA